MWVFSASENFLRRQAIRQTWGAVELYEPMRVVVIFSLAVTLNPDIQSKILTEQTQYGDIVQDGTFVDAYKNLTFKVSLSVNQ